MSTKSHKQQLFSGQILWAALGDTLRKLAPQQQWKNPVMFVVYIGSLLTTGLWLWELFSGDHTQTGFMFAVTFWLWFTVLFANFAESVAEGRSKAQAASLRNAKRDIMAKKLDKPCYSIDYAKVTSTSLRRGDIVLIEAGDFVPADGEVIEGAASVDESAITGESAPVIRESGGDFSSITGGTRVLSDWLVARVVVNPGEAFLDRMIAMVESASRQKNAKRNRPDYLAGGIDADFPADHRDAAAVFPVQRRNRQIRHTGIDHRTGGLAGLPDSYHHRRFAVRYRGCRHRQDDAEKRHSHIR